MKRKKTNSPPRKTWSVRVSPATREPHYHYDYDPKGKPIEGKVAVRIMYDGRDRYTFATLNIKDADFGDKVTTAKAEALERASELEAVGAE